MLVLGIETSCDETAAALYHSERGLLAHRVHSQTDTHAKYGGVVPELASRDHIRKTLPIIDSVIADVNCRTSDITGVAYTKGPGLIGALMVGACVGRSLAFGWDVPSIGVHHIEAHLLAAMLEEQKPTWPFLALIVSGGHTLLVKVTGLGQYELLGQSVDDAVGEAFDKTAKLLGLPYPGGAALAKLAGQGDPTRFSFPRPMLKQDNLDFSFSGLKTHAMLCCKQHTLDEQTKADIACAFEEAVVDVLVQKTLRALQQTDLQQLVVAGGVAANQKLRARFLKHVTLNGGEVFYPRPEFCTDNAAMVAYTGCCRLQAGQRDDLKISTRVRWPLQECN